MNNKQNSTNIREKEVNKVSISSNYITKKIEIKPLKPQLFLKKTNAEIKPVTFKSLGELHGQVRHFPAQAQEWVNSVYSYNSHYNKLLTIADKNLMTLVKSYLNLRFKRTQKNKKIKKTIIARLRLGKYRGRNKGRFHTKKKQLSVNKLFVAKGNIKHTSTTAIITIFLLKKMENLVWLKSIKRLVYLSKNSKFTSHYLPELAEKKFKYKFRKCHRRVHFKLLKIRKILYFLNERKVLNNEESFILYMSNNFREFPLIPRLKKSNIVWNPSSFYQNKGSVKAIADWRARSYHKIVFKYIRFFKFLKLNELKFKKNFLENFRKIACKIYNKNVIFNFVKIKKYYYNSDIFSQIIALKLRRREYSVSTVLSKSLDNIKLPLLPAKSKFNISKKTLQINRMHHKNIFDLLSFAGAPAYIGKSHPEVENQNILHTSSEGLRKQSKKNFWFELLLFKYYRVVNPLSLFGRMKLEHRKTQILSHNSLQSLKEGALPGKAQKWRAKKQMARLFKYFYFKANFIKHRDLAGVRVEARGRLTKRFKASRTLYKLKWVGGLRNIDSSYKGLPAVMLRGHALSNVQYSCLSSKRKIGAYGVKGWVSGF